jgi:hypothetical protein
MPKSRNRKVGQVSDKPQIKKAIVGAGSGTFKRAVNGRLT